MYSHLEQEGVKGTPYFPCRETDMIVICNHSAGLHKMRTFVLLLPSILSEVDSLLLKLILFDAACELGFHFQCA